MGKQIAIAAFWGVGWQYDCLEFHSFKVSVGNFIVKHNDDLARPIIEETFCRDEGKTSILWFVNFPDTISDSFLLSVPLVVQVR